MKLSIGNSATRVHQATEEETEWLYGYLSFEDVNADMKARVTAQKIRLACERKGYTEDEIQDRIAASNAGDRIRLYRRGRKLFPTGLLPLVRKGCGDQGFELVEVDTRGELTRATLSGLDQPPLTLRPYQVDCVTALLEGAQATPDPGTRCAPYLLDHQDPGRGILHSPTGSGKGSMAIAIVHSVPGKWLFLVHRGHLASDVKERWDTTVGPLEGCEAGMIGAGEWTEGRRLTCATLQTLYESRGSQRFKDLCASVTGLICDESHVAPADTFYKTIMSFDQARHRIGLSGTPLARGDRKGLVAIGALGPVVYRVRPQELIDQGFLAPPQIRVVPCYQKTPAGAHEYRAVYDKLVVNSAHRNAAVCRAAQLCEKPGIVFVESLRHGMLVMKALRKLGFNTEFVSGKTNKHMRLRAIQDLGEGRLDLLVATRVFNEGVDIPDLRGVVMAAAGKSEIAALQRVGRALRPAQGKEAAMIYEIGDKGNRYLHDHAKHRFRSYRREGYPVIVDEDVYPESGGNGTPLRKMWENLLKCG